MLKAAGCILILAASAGFGFLSGRELKQRLEELKYLKKLLLILRGEIKYTKAPFPEAFRNISKRCKMPFSDFFKNLGEELDKLSGKGFPEIWKERIELDLKELKLNQADRMQLNRLGEQFGYLDGEMQINTIDLYMEQLETEIKTAEKETAGKVRLFNCLGIMGGIFVLLIII